MRPDWLREAFAEDDAFRATREWEAQKTSWELVYNTTELPRPEPTPEPEPEPFTEYQSDVLAHVIVELRKEWREKRDEAIAPLKAEIADLKAKLDVAELKGKVDALLQGAKADVINLPRRHPSDAA